MADSMITIHASSKDAALTRVTAGRHTLIVDEPVPFGGTDTAPSPIMFLLAGLAGCVNAAGRLAAKEMGFSLRGLEIEVSGNTDPARFFGEESPNRAGFKAITVEITADCDASEQTLRAWLEQVRYRCPVIDNLEHTTPLTFCIKGDGGC